jgi:branched-subunit amino acid transport protein
VSLEALITILGMAAVTYGIRMSGLLLANRLPTTGFVAAWMRHVPGAVLASLVAPVILRGGIAESIAAAATALAYVLTRNLFVAMIAGVGAVYLARTFWPA